MMFVSIHTPTQGVTVGISGDSHFGYVSIHTPTQGVTPTHRSSFDLSSFQSTHPRRV
jgi:hypothetical protein